MKASLCCTGLPKTWTRHKIHGTVVRVKFSTTQEDRESNIWKYDQLVQSFSMQERVSVPLCVCVCVQKSVRILGHWKAMLEKLGTATASLECNVTISISMKYLPWKSRNYLNFHSVSHKIPTKKSLFLSYINIHRSEL